MAFFVKRHPLSAPGLRLSLFMSTDRPVNSVAATDTGEHLGWSTGAVPAMRVKTVACGSRPGVVVVPGLSPAKAYACMFVLWVFQSPGAWGTPSKRFDCPTWWGQQFNPF